MKRIPCLIMIMVITIFISPLFTSCVKEASNSIANEVIENENFLAEQKKNEVTRVTSNGLIIYEQKREIKLNTDLCLVGKEQLLKEAYNKPGKMIMYEEKIQLNYNPRKLLTEYSRSPERIMLYYNKSAEQFIFQTDKPKTITGVDLIPLIVILALFGVNIFSLYTKSKLEKIMPFWLCIFIFVLALNYMTKTQFAWVSLNILYSLINVLYFFIPYFIAEFILGKLWFKEIPMKNGNGNGNVVVSFSLIASLALLIYTNSSSNCIYIYFTFIISPYLVYWSYLLAKSIKLPHLKKIEK